MAAGAAILSRHADATLMVAAAGQTRRVDLHRATEKLDQVGATILGTVLNKVTRQTGRYYSYSYNYRPYTMPTAAAIPKTHNGHSKKN